MSVDNSAEVVFAQRLAANEKTIRDRALKKLRKYLSVRGSESDFTREDLRKLWKGLHYSMWMQDKPLLQEELSARMCGLLKVFSNGTSALNFAAAFFATQANEWNRLDQWRMDKYMMLTRDFLRATLEVLSSRQWEESLVSQMAQLVEEEVMDAMKEENPDGLRLHLADIWLQELATVGASQLNGSQILTLLKPFITYIIKSKRDVITDRVINSVFLSILEEPKAEGDENANEVEENQAEVPKLQYNLRAIADTLFEEGKQNTVRPKVRRKLYHLVQRFKEAAPQEEPAKAKKRKTSEDETPKVKKLKKEKTQATERTPKTLKTPKPSKAAKDTPETSEKHVVFDLQRNSMRGLQEFVMSAVESPSPFLPSKSPKQGILKDSPGATPKTALKSSKKKSFQTSLQKGTEAEKDIGQGKQLTSKGKKSSGKGGKSDEKTGGAVKGKKKSAKLLARKKARMMKKSKRL